MPTFAETLATSDALEEKIAAAATDDARENLRRKKAFVDFTAFGLYKEAQGSAFLPALRQAAGWGVGLGVPAVAAGTILSHVAKSNAMDVLHQGKMQALYSALGLGGAGALNKGLDAVLKGVDPRQLLTDYFPGNDQQADLATPKFGSDTREELQKLAALLLLDDVLVGEIGHLNGEEKLAAEECLLINRKEGTSLLKRLLQ